MRDSTTGVQVVHRVAEYIDNAVDLFGPIARRGANLWFPLINHIVVGLCLKIGEPEWFVDEAADEAGRQLQICP